MYNFPFFQTNTEFGSYLTHSNVPEMSHLFQVIGLLSFIWSISCLICDYTCRNLFPCHLQGLFHRTGVPSKYWFLNISSLGYLCGLLELSLPRHVLVPSLLAPPPAQVPSSLCAPLKESGILAVDLFQEKSLPFSVAFSSLKVLYLSPLLLPPPQST